VNKVPRFEGLVCDSFKYKVSSSYRISEIQNEENESHLYMLPVSLKYGYSFFINRSINNMNFRVITSAEGQMFAIRGLFHKVV